MVLSHSFRRSMPERLLQVLGAALLIAPAIVAASCGGKVVFDGGQGAGTGGAAGGSSQGGSAGSGTCTSKDPGGDLIQVTECFPSPDGTTCPNPYMAIGSIIPSSGCNYVVSVDCGPISPDSGNCCYLVTEEPQPCSNG